MAVTADDFRELVLGLDGAIEGAHMGHPDFRATGRIFASLQADDQHATLKRNARGSSALRRAPGPVRRTRRRG